jgi:hypothetical protein
VFMSNTPERSDCKTDFNRQSLSSKPYGFTNHLAFSAKNRRKKTNFLF